MIVEQNRFDKITVFVFAILLTFVLSILAITPPALDYEVSIYGVYQWYFWALIITILIMSIILILFSDSRKHLVFGFIFIIITNVILLSIQFARGYFFYHGGDLFTHIGFSRDILELRHLSSDNFYPLQHILMIDFEKITNISIEVSSRLLSIIFYLLFVISLYVFLSKYSFTKHKYSLALGTLLIFGSNYVTPIPNILSFLFFSFALFILIQIKLTDYKIRFNILLFIVVLSVIFFHPITSLYLILILVIFKITSYFSNEYLEKHDEITHLDKTILASTGAWTLWHMGFSSIRKGINRTLNSIFYQSTLNPRAKEITRTMRLVDIKISDIARKFVFDYGIFSILLLIILVYFIYLYYDDRKIKYFLKQKEVLFFASIIFIFTCWSVLNIFADFVTFSRVFKVIIFFSFLLIGGIYSFLMGFKFDFYMRKNNVHTFIIVMLVVFIIIVSVFGIYPSPPSLSNNSQITKQENNGMRWLFDIQNEDRLIWEEGIRQYRWADFIYGVRGENRPSNIRRETNVEEHFGYEEYDRMGKNYSGYFIKTDIVMITYQNVLPDYEDSWRFNESDHTKLERDSTVNEIYDNGFFNTYYIREVEER